MARWEGDRRIARPVVAAGHDGINHQIASEFADACLVSRPLLIQNIAAIMWCREHSVELLPVDSQTEHFLLALSLARTIHVISKLVHFYYHNFIVKHAA